jgi:DNA-binding XRE family transcriptional regulator
MVIACLSAASTGDGSSDHQSSPRLFRDEGERERRRIMMGIRGHISTNLKFLREQKGWTQEQAAKEYGVTIMQVAKYENGQNAPEVERLGFICDKVYGVSVDSVMGLKKFTISSPE